MSFSLVPDYLFFEYSQITPEFLQQRGIRLVLCDLDYTLAPRSMPEPDGKVRAWLASLLQAGIQVLILSNNRSCARVDRFCSDLPITYVGHAGKPSCRGFRTAMQRCGVTAEQTAMLGDKLLTDVLGAKRSGVTALMVEPKDGPVGAWNHVLHFLQRPFKSMCRRKYL